MRISQIQLIETGDATFTASFFYESRNLITAPLPRTASANDVRDAIRSEIERWDSRRASKNFEALKKEFEGKAEIDV